MFVYWPRLTAVPDDIAVLGVAGLQCRPRQVLCSPASRTLTVPGGAGVACLPTGPGSGEWPGSGSGKWVGPGRGGLAQHAAESTGAPYWFRGNANSGLVSDSKPFPHAPNLPLQILSKNSSRCILHTFMSSPSSLVEGKTWAAA